MRRILLLSFLLLSSPAVADVSSADYTDRWQVQAHELLRDSVAFKTYRGENQVLPMVDMLAETLVDGGFPRSAIDVLHLDSDGEPTATLIVRYKGSSTNKKPILFVGHTDVVPAAGDWSKDPFVLTEDNGRYWGRGTLDDKFAVAIMTTTFLRLWSEGFQPERDLILVFFGDEETRMLTTKSVTEDHLDLIDAEVAFNLDAGAGRIDEAGNPVAVFLQFAEKMYVTFEITATNPGGHSSKPTPENAIADIARAVTAIHDFDFPVQWVDESRRYFATMGARTEGELGAAMRRFANDPGDVDAVAFLSGQPEQVGLIRTTCVPTMLRGGHVENALPESATVTVNCRVFPGVSVAEVEAMLVQAVDNPDIEFKSLYDSLPSPPSGVREDVMSLISSAMREEYAAVPIVPYVAPYATDGVFLRRAGITTYGLYGMFLKDGEDNSHSSNESLPIDRFYEALEFWYQFMQDASSL